jgi:hypothetical protein
MTGNPGPWCRSRTEARASLPGLMGIADPPPEEVFAALLLQRLRLDQQVPEWTSESPTSSI